MNFIELEEQLNTKLEGEKTLRNIIDFNISKFKSYKVYFWT